jgi:hypothetical protein
MFECLARVNLKNLKEYGFTKPFYCIRDLSCRVRKPMYVHLSFSPASTPLATVSVSFFLMDFLTFYTRLSFCISLSYWAHVQLSETALQSKRLYEVTHWELDCLLVKPVHCCSITYWEMTKSLCIYKNIRNGNKSTIRMWRYFCIIFISHSSFT